MGVCGYVGGVWGVWGVCVWGGVCVCVCGGGGGGVWGGGGGGGGVWGVCLCGGVWLCVCVCVCVCVQRKHLTPFQRQPSLAQLFMEPFSCRSPAPWSGVAKACGCVPRTSKVPLLLLPVAKKR